MKLLKPSENNSNGDLKQPYKPGYKHGVIDGILLSATVAALLAVMFNGGGASIPPQDKNSPLAQALLVEKSPPVQAPLGNEELENRAKAIAVKVSSGAARGSGILLDKQGSTYTVATNAHVVKKGENNQIETPDGKQHQAKLIVRFEEDKSGDDLAILQFSSQNEYEVAKLRDSSTLEKEEKVFAAGFPGSTEQFTFKDGDYSLRLDKPLKGGYQIAYNIDIEKGMSGGPLLNNRGELVGINGKHQPIWGNEYEYKDGSSPRQASDELDRYSWAIPIETLAGEWAKLPSQSGGANSPAPTPNATASATSNSPSCSQQKPPDASPIVKESGKVRSQIFYDKQDEAIANLRLIVNRDGEALPEKPLSVEASEKIENVQAQIRDLEGDGEPEIIVDLMAEGAPGYFYSLIYRYDSQAKEYSYKRQPWGAIDCDRRYELKDLNNDGSQEFVSDNRNFAQKFVSDLQDSGFPKQIWQYRQGSMYDVTRQHPQEVRKHVKELWNAYQERKQRKQEVKGVLAAYLAEKYLLREGEDGWKQVKRAYKESDREQYFKELETFLKLDGYIR